MEAYIVGGVRTAIGRFNGSLASLNTIDLGSAVIKEVVEKNLDPRERRRSHHGERAPGRPGPEPGAAGRHPRRSPGEHPCLHAEQGLRLGAEVGRPRRPGHCCGRSECHHRRRHGAHDQRPLRGEVGAVGTASGQRRDDRHARQRCPVGHVLRDSHGYDRRERGGEVHDHPGGAGRFRRSSQKKTEQAIKDGNFKDEIVPLRIKQPKGADKIFDTDEHPRFGTTVESLAKLEPAFKTEGTVTAGNASGINDGAAAVLVVSRAKMKELKPAWAFRIKGASSAALDPAFMGLGPINACKSLVTQAKLGSGPRPHRDQRGVRVPVDPGAPRDGMGHGQGERARRRHRPRASRRGERNADPRHPDVRDGAERREPGARLAVHRRRPGHRHDRRTGQINLRNKIAAGNLIARCSEVSCEDTFLGIRIFIVS